jgi:putative salt-induced outer membrane protein YdiY
MNRQPFHLLTPVMACALLLACAFASAADSPPKPGRELPDLSWVPPEDSFDWIQLKSGEWLKGKLKALQDRELQFDSEEMDYQDFEWEKIRQLRTARPVQIRLTSGEVVSGRAMVTPTEAWLMEDPSRKWPRGQLQSVTPAGSRERSYWSGDVSIGLTKRSGNVEQMDYNSYAHLQRRNPGTRVLLDYIANYSSARDEVNADNWRLSARLDTWLTDRFFIVLPAFEYYSDPLQNIGDRTTLGAGVAYDLFYSPDFEWSVIGGPAYQWLRYTSAQPGEPEGREGFALGISSRMEWDITRDIDLTLEYKGQFTSKSAGETTHHGLAQLSVDVTKRLEVEMSLTWDRIVNPELTADGTQPESDDVRLVFGLGYEF